MSEELAQYWWCKLRHLCRDSKNLPSLSLPMPESICQASSISVINGRQFQRSSSIKYKFLPFHYYSSSSKKTCSTCIKDPINNSVTVSSCACIPQAVKDCFIHQEMVMLIIKLSTSNSALTSILMLCTTLSLKMSANAGRKVLI